MTTLSAAQFRARWEDYVKKYKYIEFDDVKTKTERAKMYEFLKERKIEFEKRACSESSWICKTHKCVYQCEDAGDEDAMMCSCHKQRGQMNYCNPIFAECMYVRRIRVLGQGQKTAETDTKEDAEQKETQAKLMQYFQESR